MESSSFKGNHSQLRWWFRREGKMPKVWLQRGFSLWDLLKKTKQFAYFKLCLGKLQPFNPVNTSPLRYCHALWVRKMCEALDPVITILHLRVINFVFEKFTIWWLSYVPWQNHCSFIKHFLWRIIITHKLCLSQVLLWKSKVQTDFSNSEIPIMVFIWLLTNLFINIYLDKNLPLT